MTRQASYKPSRCVLLRRLSVVENLGKRPDPTSATLAGLYGAIWAWNYSGRYFVLVTSARVNNRWRADKIADGDENGFVCDEAEALLWVERLRIAGTRPKQVRLMEQHCRGGGL